MTIQPVIARNFTACMEQLQEAYVYSVASTVGCIVERKNRDRYGVDVEFKLPRDDYLEELTIYAQLKCTTTIDPDPSKPTFGYRFRDRRHFDQLAKPRATIKAILIVMVTSPIQAAWTEVAHDQLIIRQACYWMNLEGAKPSSPKTPTVAVPIANIFDGPNLIEMFQRLEQGLRI
jgi:Domain of unknown function (DUF4365)